MFRIALSVFWFWSFYLGLQGAVGELYAAGIAPDVKSGCLYQLSPPTLTDGQPTTINCDNIGNLKTNCVAGCTGGAPPYAAPANMVRGSASSTVNTAVALIAAGGVGVKTYITGLECYRSDAGTAAVTVTFSDANSMVMVLPNSGGGGGSNVSLNVPLVTAANTAFTFTVSAATTTVYCNAQGYSGA
jgi:hypothetical protein